MPNTPARLTYKRKDRRGWQAFLDGLKALDPKGRGGDPARYPGETAAASRLGRRHPENCRCPAMIIVGDEDGPALEPSIYLKRDHSERRLVGLPEHRPRGETRKNPTCSTARFSTSSSRSKQGRA